jgi:hypothetical protein
VFDFEKVFVISLDFREDRRKEFLKKASPLFPKLEVWRAVHGDTCQPPDIWCAGAGAWGCMRSHQGILEYCLNNDISSYLVFEDDAQFRPDFLEQYKAFMDEVPEDWQQIYLGGDLMHSRSHPPIKVTDNVYRPHNVNRTHCFGVSRAGMLPLYRHISNLPYYDAEHIDHHLGRWHESPENRVYCPARWMVGQMGCSSNISGKVEPVTFFKDPIEQALSHPLYDNPICVYYRGPSGPLKAAKKYLHCGKNLDAHGYDIGLTMAAKFANPLPGIHHWYNWIRSEIASGRASKDAVPCCYHPRIKKEDLQKVCPNIIEIESIEQYVMQVEGVRDAV